MSQEVGGNKVWTVKDILFWSTAFLRERLADASSARLDVELLLALTLECSRIQLYTGIDKPLTATERTAFRALLRRRAAGEPMAYILGEREFYGIKLAVDSRVLIPRPETELLVDEVLAIVREKNLVAPSILDIGTGSGCIAIALKKTLPKASRVEAWDISTAALALAESNAEMHSALVHFAQMDLHSAGAWEGAELYDFIVANPPYIAIDDPELAADVRRFEPQLALYAAENGLACYRQIAGKAARRLKSEGQLLLEIGAGMAPSVTALLEEAGWSEIRLSRDLAGHERVLRAGLNY